MASIEATTAQAIALMQAAAGEFYLRARPGLKLALWQRAERRSFAPVTKDPLCTWLEDRDVCNPYSTAIAVLQRDFSGDEFPQLDDEMLSLVSGGRRR